MAATNLAMQRRLDDVQTDLTNLGHTLREVGMGFDKNKVELNNVEAVLNIVRANLIKLEAGLIKPRTED